MKTVRIKPISKREHIVVDRLGADGWDVLQESNPIGFDGRTALLVKKDGHTRWMLKEQTEEMENEKS